MITLNDCKAICDAAPATIARTARQQHLPKVLAIACAHGLVLAAQSVDARRAINSVRAAVAVRRLAA